VTRGTVGGKREVKIECTGCRLSRTIAAPGAMSGICWSIGARLKNAKFISGGSGPGARPISSVVTHATP
jgi:hypothetical protein